ncbi:MAG: universal stress protein [Planctomycetota bacterium]|nr:universal stress protein [Planctomycetota bacterium]
MRLDPLDSGLLPQRLLVALDEDHLADPAILAAAQLARRLGSGVEYFHAVRPPMFGWQRSEGRHAAAEQRVLDRAQADMASRVERALLQAGLTRRPDEHISVGLGSPGRAVAERAEAVDADWVFLGALKRPGSTFDFGGTARAVLSHVDSGVWVQPAPPQPIRRILVPVDLGIQSLHALATAGALARLLGARIHVLSCFEPVLLATSYPEIGLAWDPSVLREAMRAEYESALQAFAWRGVEHTEEFVDGTPAQQILARERDADLIVMGTHGRGRLASTLLGSVAYPVLKHATKPILALRTPEHDDAA